MSFIYCHFGIDLYAILSNVYTHRLVVYIGYIHCIHLLPFVFKCESAVRAVHHWNATDLSILFCMCVSVCERSGPAFARSWTWAYEMNTMTSYRVLCAHELRCFACRFAWESLLFSSQMLIFVEKNPTQQSLRRLNKMYRVANAAGRLCVFGHHLIHVHASSDGDIMEDETAETAATTNTHNLLFTHFNFSFSRFFPVVSSSLEFFCMYTSAGEIATRTWGCFFSVAFVVSTLVDEVLQICECINIFS